MCLRSRIHDVDECRPGKDILVVDTLGEMLTFYHLADIVFVGGSLVPHGGHNLIEGAMVEKPVVFGPYMHNFKDMALLFEASRAGVQCGDDGELETVLSDLLDHPDKAVGMGQNGAGLIREHAGATEKTMGIIRGLMDR